MEGRRLNYLLRQRSLNYQLSRQDSEDGISIPMCSRGRKSVDKKDSSDFENNCCLKDKNRSAQIKLLAIYDDANAIMKILKSEGNPESGKTESVRGKKKGV